jgi:hypothetical protein
MARFVLIFLLLVNLYGNAFCQKDSICVVNCFKYSVIDGKNTGQRIIYKQKTFDKYGKLVREMFYYDTILQIKNIVFYFYKDKMLISKEEYNNDNTISRINRYYYNSSGYLTEEFVFEPNNNIVEKKLRTTFSYQDTFLTQKMVYDSKNKLVEKTTREKIDFQLIETTKYNKRAVEGNMKEKIMISNFSGQHLIKTEFYLTYSTGKKVLNTIDYVYDTTSVIIETQTYKDNENKVSGIIEIKHRKDGTVQNEAIKNGVGKLIEFYAYEMHYYIRDQINKEMYKLQN